MIDDRVLFPNYNDGRAFVSPILGCTGGCAYCYLPIKNYKTPMKNDIPVDKWVETILKMDNFVLGKEGTIISVGAWGDIFPKNNPDLIYYSVNTIAELLKLGNPVQIMSKFSLEDKFIEKICSNIQYENQFLYSTTITTIKNWKLLEPNTEAPINRLNTCYNFQKRGAIINVLLKPFILPLMDEELEDIANLLLKYNITYCVLGSLYWDKNLKDKICKNSFLKSIISDEFHESHLDCNGEDLLFSNNTSVLKRCIKYLRTKGLNAFLKSSCINSNILKISNPSKYFLNNNDYCIQCGNCIFHP